MTNATRLTVVVSAILLFFAVESIYCQLCIEDQWEKNDSQGTAAIITPPIFIQGTLCNETIDVFDWFRIDFTNNTILELRLTTTSGDLDLFLRDGDGTLIALSQGEEGKDFIEYDVIPGTYYIQVKPYADTSGSNYMDAGSTYAFNVTTRPGTTLAGAGLCLDTYDPDNDLWTGAPDISGVLPMNGVSFTLCNQDPDYYKIVVTTPSVITVRVNFVQSFPLIPFDVDAYLFRAIYVEDLFPAELSSATAKSPEQFTGPLSVGTYYLLIQQYYWWHGNYNLTVILTPNGPPPNPTESTQEPTENTADQNKTPPEDKPSKSNNTVVYAVVGTIVGLLVFCVALGAVTFFLLKKYREEERMEMKAMGGNDTPSRAPSGFITPAAGPSAQGPIPNYNQSNSSGSPSAQQMMYSPGQYSNGQIPNHSNHAYARIDSTGGSSSLGMPMGSGVIAPTPHVSAPASHTEKFDIDYRELTGWQPIGRGSFGVVFKCKWRETVVAVKQLHDVDEKALADFRGEAAIFINLRAHPNVVLFMGITSPPQPITIVTEFCDGGSLYSLIHSDAKITPDMQFRMLNGIARGMLHLHSEKIIHRDLAARNVLLTEHLDVKVSDFGLSRQKQDDDVGNKTKSDIGPLKWMSPEAIKDKIYSTKSDVWSFGVVMWELVARRDPYENMDSVAAAMAVVYEGLRLPVPEGCSPIIAGLMSDCWQVDPAKRPGFKELCTALNWKENNAGGGGGGNVYSANNDSKSSKGIPPSGPGNFTNNNNTNSHTPPLSGGSGNKMTYPGSREPFIPTEYGSIETGQKRPVPVPSGMNQPTNDYTSINLAVHQPQPQQPQNNASAMPVGMATFAAPAQQPQQQQANPFMLLPPVNQQSVQQAPREENYGAMSTTNDPSIAHQQMNYGAMPQANSPNMNIQPQPQQPQAALEDTYGAMSKVVEPPKQEQQQQQPQSQSFDFY